MSTGLTKGKNLFLIIARDIQSTLRTKHFHEHMKRMDPLIESGKIVAGGGLLPKGSLTSDTEALGRMNGTIVIVRAEDEAEVWSFLRQDVFYTSGEVWDNSTIEVTPVLLGAPKID